MTEKAPRMLYPWYCTSDLVPNVTFKIKHIKDAAEVWCRTVLGTFRLSVQVINNTSCKLHQWGNLLKYEWQRPQSNPWAGCCEVKLFRFNWSVLIVVYSLRNRVFLRSLQFQDRTPLGPHSWDPILVFYILLRLLSVGEGEFIFHRMALKITFRWKSTLKLLFFFLLVRRLRLG